MNTTTRQLNSDLTRLVRYTIYQTLEEIGYDPDYGLELDPSFVRKLKKRIASKEKGTPLEVVMKKYGIKT